jgi:hypothetical protein
MSGYRGVSIQISSDVETRLYMFVIPSHGIALDIRGKEED